MNVLLILPLLIPLSAATLSLFAWRSRRTQRVLGVVGTALLLGSVLMLLRSVSRGGIQVTQVGAWPAPFGITIVADLFSAIMLVLTVGDGQRWWPLLLFVGLAGLSDGIGGLVVGAKAGDLFPATSLGMVMGLVQMGRGLGIMAAGRSTP